MLRFPAAKFINSSFSPAIGVKVIAFPECVWGERPSEGLSTGTAPLSTKRSLQRWVCCRERALLGAGGEDQSKDRCGGECV